MAQSKRWCFTLNNYSDGDIALFKNLSCLYMVFGYEVAESGTPHLQGFLTLKNKQRLAGMKKIHATAHWEAAKGTSLQASEYCKKDGNFYEHGTPPSQGKRSDLETATTKIKAGASVATVAMDYPSLYVRYGRGLRDFALLCNKPYDHHDVRGFWFHGKPGTGKSLFARTYPSLYLKQQNKWFDAYDNEETILLDDLDTDVLGHHLKIWADRYACTGETKGGTVPLRHHRFIVTSNFTIDDLFSGSPEICSALKRRFTVRNFDLFPFRYFKPTDDQA